MDECVPWDGSVNNHGYGVHSDGARGAVKYAHRTAYEAFYGPIGDGRMILHSCGNRSCINPLHLREGDHKMNMADSVADGTHNNARKMACPKGHPYSGDNLIVWNDGKRRCRACLHTRAT